MSLYTDMLAAGLVIGNHYSDLYTKDTPEAWAIFEKHKEWLSRPGRFVSLTGEGPCLDFAFAYDPFWDAKAGTTSVSAAAPVQESDL